MSMIQKQIEELQKYADEYDPNINDLSGRAVEGTERVLRNAAETIEQLSAKLTASNLNDGWIPVETERPTEQGFYLVTDCDEDVFEAQYLGCGFYTMAVEPIDCDVTAWMPLPKPYESGGK